jgi:Flp pilus assembly protein TadG
MVEFALISLILFTMTAGLVDAGRAFWAYNAVASSARFAARWAAVQGGSCAAVTYESSADWCNQNGATTNFFWGQYGNYPLASTGTCPAGYTAGSSSYYTVSNTSAADTTVVGSLRGHLDTSSSSWYVTLGGWLAGIDTRQMYVCISLPTSSNEYDSTRAVTQTESPWMPAQGSAVTVYVYYVFQPVGGLLGKNLQVNMAASSQYTME